MRVHKVINVTVFMSLVQRIRSEIDEWKAVDIVLEKNLDQKSLMPVVHQVEDYFGSQCDGDIFICSKKELIALVRLGRSPDFSDIKEGITKSVQDQICDVSAGSITPQGLQTIEIRIKDSSRQAANSDADAELFQERLKRPGRKVFIIDENDLTQRQISISLNKHLGSACSCFTFTDVREVVDCYLKELPDMVITDIEFSKGSGFELIEKILSYDKTAFVVAYSAKSTLENARRAKELGARGFLVKPLNEERLPSLLEKCKTL